MKTVPLRHAATLRTEVLPDWTDRGFEFRYIDISAVGSDGTVAVPNESISFGDAPSRARRLAQPGDTLLSTVRTYLRAIAQVPQLEEPTVFSTGFAVLRSAGGDSRFLTYCCRSHPVVEQVMARSVGVSYPAISPGELLSVQVPDIGVDEQRRIADFLDDRVSRIDQIIAARREQLGLVDAEFSSKMYELLADLPRVPLRRFAREILVGIVIQPARLYTDEEDGVPTLRGLNVGEGQFQVADLVKITPEGHRANSRSQLAEGDVVIVRTGDAGSAAVIGPEMVNWNCIDLVVVRCGPAIVPAFVAWMFNAARRDTTVASASSGSIQQHFGVGAVAEHPIPHASRQEQYRIIAALDLASEQRRTRQEQLMRSVKLHTEYKSSLITAAVTGELDVTTASTALPEHL